MLRDSVTAIGGASLLLVAGTILVVGLGRPLNILLPSVVGFVLRVGFGLASCWGLVAPASDTRGYDQWAIDIVSAWEGDNALPALPLGKEGWPLILAGIYRLLGYAPEAASVLNALVGTLTIIITSASCRVLGWTLAEKPAAWLMALWPVAVYWSPQLLREAIATNLLAVGLLGAALLGTRRYLVGACLILAAGVSMITIRGGLTFLILFGLPVTVGVAHILTRSNSKAALRGLLLAALLVFFVAPVLVSRFLSAAYLEDRRETGAYEGSNRGTTSFEAARVDANSNDVVSLVTTALGPFPFSWTNSALVIAGLDGLLWTLLWLLAIRAFRHVAVNRWARYLFIIPLVALLFYLSDYIANFGTLMRWRSLGTVFLVPLAAYGIGIFLTKRHTQRAGARHLSRRRRPWDPTLRTPTSGRQSPGTGPPCDDSLRYAESQ